MDPCLIVVPNSRTYSIVWKIFLLSQGQRSAVGVYWVRASDAAKHAVVLRRSSSLSYFTVGHGGNVTQTFFKKVPIFYQRRRQWHPTPVLLPGKFHGWRSLVGCSPRGCEELDTTERLHFHFSLSCSGEGNGSPLQCSYLENPRVGGAWWAAIYGVAQSQTRLKWLSSSSSSTVYQKELGCRGPGIIYTKCGRQNNPFHLQGHLCPSPWSCEYVVSSMTMFCCTAKWNSGC